jgi:hypothetical protein
MGPTAQANASDDELEYTAASSVVKAAPGQGALHPAQGALLGRARDASSDGDDADGGASNKGAGAFWDDVADGGHGSLEKPEGYVIKVSVNGSGPMHIPNALLAAWMRWWPFML